MVAPPSALFGGWALGLGFPHWCRRGLRFRITPLQFHCLPLIQSHWPRLPQNVLPRTAPAPLFGTQYQAAPYRVAMHVANVLLDLRLAPHHKVVESPLPDVLRLQAHFPQAALGWATRLPRAAQERSRESLLEHLHHADCPAPVPPTANAWVRASPHIPPPPSDTFAAPPPKSSPTRPAGVAFPAARAVESNWW